MDTADAKSRLKALLRCHVAFAVLDDADLDSLCDDGELVTFALGETVVAEGSDADAAYLIFSGEFRVVKDGPAGKPVTLRVLGPGELFGEHGVLTGERRTATVRAAANAILFRLGRPAFVKLLERCPHLRGPLERLAQQRAFARFLQLATALGPLPGREILALLERFSPRTFASGEVIFREGEPGDRMYFVEDGEVKIARGQAGNETVLAYLGPGDYFGERALLLSEPRYASAWAMSATSCRTLDRASFALLEQEAPQVHSRLRQRLEGFAEAEELARRVGVMPPGKAEPAIVFQPLADTTLPAGVPRRAWPWWRPYPLVLQEEEADCGAASLAMIAAFHGVRLSLERLRQLAHVGPDGASLAGLTAAAEQLGFSWRAVATDFEHLNELPLPAVAHWRGYHYLVLYEARRDRVVLGDPATGLLTMTRTQFMEGWNGNLLLLTPTSRLDALAGPSLGEVAVRAVAGRHRRLLRGAFACSLAMAAAVVAVLLAPGLAFNAAAGGLLVALGCWRRKLLETYLARIALDLEAAGWRRLVQLPPADLQSRPMEEWRERIRVDTAGADRILWSFFLNLPLFLTAVGLGLLAPWWGDESLDSSPFTRAEFVLAWTGAMAIGLVLWLAALWRKVSCSVTASDGNRAALGQIVAAAKNERRLAALVDRHVAQSYAVAETGEGTRWTLVSTLAIVPLLAAGLMPLLWATTFVPREQWTSGLWLACTAAAMALFWLAAVHYGLGVAWSTVVRTRRRLVGILDLPPEDSESSPRFPGPCRGYLRLDDVTYRPHPESPALLSHLSLDAEPGKTLWIIGRAGSGKTTLARLLARLDDCSEGTLLLDGIRHDAVSRSAWRREVAVVFTDPALVPGTVRDNIALGEGDRERLRIAARLAGADDLIERLPHGYETMVGPGGVALSLGERQLLALARGFYLNPRVLVLDDVMAMFDREREQTLRQTLQAWGQDRTVLFLSRRPPEASIAGDVAILDAGRIVERGRHGQLLQQGGIYCRWLGR